MYWISDHLYWISDLYKSLKDAPLGEKLNLRFFISDIIIFIRQIDASASVVRIHCFPSPHHVLAAISLLMNLKKNHLNRSTTPPNMRYIRFLKSFLKSIRNFSLRDTPEIVCFPRTFDENPRRRRQTITAPAPTACPTLFRKIVAIIH